MSNLIKNIAICFGYNHSDWKFITIEKTDIKIFKNTSVSIYNPFPSDGNILNSIGMKVIKSKYQQLPFDLNQANFKIVDFEACVNKILETPRGNKEENICPKVKNGNKYYIHSYYGPFETEDPETNTKEYM